jgi:hypothetical protein
MGTTWSETTVTKITIFIGIGWEVDWSDNDHYGIGGIQLPRRIFTWPNSDRVFTLEAGWQAKQSGDNLLISPLSLRKGDARYEEFAIPLAAVENIHRGSDTAYSKVADVEESAVSVSASAPVA